MFCAMMPDKGSKREKDIQAIRALFYLLGHKGRLKEVVGLRFIF
jgi:hypothetical protein